MYLGVMVVLAGQVLAQTVRHSLDESSTIIQTGTHAESAQEICRLSRLDDLDVTTLARWVGRAKYENRVTSWDPSTKLADAATIILVKTKVSAFRAIRSEIDLLTPGNDVKPDRRTSLALFRFRAILQAQDETKSLNFVDLLTMDLALARRAALDFFDDRSSAQEIGRRLAPLASEDRKSSEYFAIFERYGKLFKTQILSQFRQESNPMALRFLSGKVDSLPALLTKWDEKKDSLVRSEIAKSIRRASPSPQELVQVLNKCAAEPELLLALPMNLRTYYYPPELLVALDRMIEQGQEAGAIQGCMIPITNEQSFKVVRKAFALALTLRSSTKINAVFNLVNWPGTDPETKVRAENFVVGIYDAYPTDPFGSQSDRYYRFYDLLTKDLVLRKIIQERMLEHIRSRDLTLMYNNAYAMMVYKMDVRPVIPILTEGIEKDQRRMNEFEGFMSWYRGDHIPILWNVSKKLRPNLNNYWTVFSALLKTKYRDEVLQKMLKEGDAHEQFRAAMMLATQGIYSDDIVDIICKNAREFRSLAPEACPRPGGPDAYKCLVALFHAAPTPAVVEALGAYIQGSQWDEFTFWLLLRTLKMDSYFDEDCRTAGANAICKANRAARNHVIFSLNEVAKSRRPERWDWVKEDRDGNRILDRGADFYKPIILALSEFAGDPSVRETLHLLLSDSDAEKRAFSMIALFESGELSEEALNAKLVDRDFSVRVAAAHLICRKAIEIGPLSRSRMTDSVLNILDQDRSIEIVVPFEKQIESINNQALQPRY